MVPTLITPPTEWPITLEEAKEQVEYLQDDRDAYIQSLIRGATAFVEKSLSLSITHKRYRLTQDRFADPIKLMRGPVTAVESVIYLDALGESLVVDPASYTVDLESRDPWIVRNTGYSWPTTLDAINAVSITYTAGMTYVPEDLLTVIRLGVQRLFERGADAKVEESLKSAIDDHLLNYATWVA